MTKTKSTKSHWGKIYHGEGKSYGYYNILETPQPNDDKDYFAFIGWNKK